MYDCICVFLFPFPEQLQRLAQRSYKDGGLPVARSSALCFGCHGGPSRLQLAERRFVVFLKGAAEAAWMGSRPVVSSWENPKSWMVDIWLIMVYGFP